MKAHFSTIRQPAVVALRDAADGLEEVRIFSGARRRRFLGVR
jgi:hypothetical protein